MNRSEPPLVFLAWEEDPAAMNIAGNVLRLCGGVAMDRGTSSLAGVDLRWQGKEIQLTYVKRSPLYLRGDELGFDPRAIVVLSKHRSEAEIPCLTVHCTGNIGEAAYGGEPRKVSIAPASMMRAALLELYHGARRAALPYSVSYEVTHHGPTLDFPVMFVEVGSSERNWSDPLAGEAAARAALAAALAYEEKMEVTIGLGGPHYAPLFTSRTITDGACFGHMVSWHQLPDFDEGSLAMVVGRNVGHFAGAALDWKGLKKDRRRIVSILEKAHVPYVRI